MGQIRQMILAALFAALTALGAWIRIPVPPSSITLQILFPAMAGVLLGRKWGAVSQLIYVALGLVGLPVFTFGGGLGAVVRPTFGFLLGMLAMAWVVGLLTERRWRTLPACLLGLAALYVVGLPYLAAIENLYLRQGWSFAQLLVGGMVIFLPWDLLKLAVVVLLCDRLRPVLRLL